MTNLKGFQDAEGAWHVAGWINNQWDQPVNTIVAEVEALDAANRGDSNLVLRLQATVYDDPDRTRVPGCGPPGYSISAAAR